MNFLSVTRDYNDPASIPVEVVERKGVGHPDSLADALANEVSVNFSQYCLDYFGFVLHHNVDKLYIGAGHFKNDFGVCERISPVQVRVNGRMSNILGNARIDIESIQEEAVSRYLFRVLPRLTAEDVEIVPNATQYTKVPHWFTPRSKRDVSDATMPKANDTSFCVCHWPPTPSESIAYRLERYFWEDKDGFAIPRFPEIGQDIKVLVLRQERTIEVTLCVPTISTLTTSYQQYREVIAKHESRLQALAEEIVSPYGLRVSVRVNPYQRLYMLGVGSCIECGEEGVVGRGNTISGIISSHRIHTQESWAGKNPDDFYGNYYLPQDGGKLQLVYFFYPSYYQSTVVRLYNFDGQAAVTKDSAIVISYEEKLSREGEPYREITSSKEFYSYEEAEAYVATQESGKYVLGNSDPFVTPVSLEEMEHYQLVYKSDQQQQGKSAVKIFEYTGSE